MTSFLALSLAWDSPSAFAGEIVLPDYHLAVTLPDGWQRTDDTNNPSPGILVSAQADSGHLRFMFTSPPVQVPQPGSMQDAAFQHGVTQSLIDKGFTQINRSEVIKIAGSDAYLCEVARNDRPDSILQVIWFRDGHLTSLVFLSLVKPFKDVPDVQTIINSVKASP